MFYRSNHICDFNCYGNNFHAPVEFKKADIKDVWSIASHLSGRLTTVGKSFVSKSWKKVELRLNLRNNWSQLFKNQSIFYTPHMDGLIYMSLKHIFQFLRFSVQIQSVINVTSTLVMYLYSESLLPYWCNISILSCLKTIFLVPINIVASHILITFLWCIFNK